MFSCKEGSNPADSSNDNHQHPPAQISDDIPYDKLGNVGRIAFSRTGPKGNNYSSICILDLVNKKNWTADGAYVAPQAPCISPDGTKLTYRGVTKGNWTIIASNVDGSDFHSFQDGSNTSYPSWGGSSDEIIFYKFLFGGNSMYQSANYNLNSAALVCNLSGLNGITSSGSTLSYFIFPQGKSIYKVMYPTYHFILSIPLETTWGIVCTPRYSPDSKFIAFAQMKTMNVNNYIYGAGGRIIISDVANQSMSTIYDWDATKVMSYAGNNDLSVCWSPDGQKLDFIKTLGDLSASVFVINVDGTGLTQVTTDQTVNDSDVSWSSN